MAEPIPHVEVHLACNDARGHFAGEVSSIALYVGLEHELTITVFESFRLTLEPLQLRIADPHDGFGLTLRTLSKEPVRWVGNLAWDSVRMPLVEASKLARFAVERGFWLEEWSNDGPLAALVRELDALERSPNRERAGAL